MSLTRGPNWPTWLKKRYVTNTGPQPISMIKKKVRHQHGAPANLHDKKNVTSPTWGPNWPFRCLDLYSLIYISLYIFHLLVHVSVAQLSFWEMLGTNWCLKVKRQNVHSILTKYYEKLGLPVILMTSTRVKKGNNGSFLKAGAYQNRCAMYKWRRSLPFIASIERRLTWTWTW